MMYLLFQHNLLNAYHLGCNDYAMLYWAKHNIIPIIRQFPTLWFWPGSLCHPWPQLPLEWGLPPLSCSLLAWSLLDSITLTWSAQKASRWCHRRTQSYWCGMQPVQTSLLPHTSQVPPVRLEQWQPGWSSGSPSREEEIKVLSLRPQSRVCFCGHWNHHAGLFVLSQWTSSWMLVTTSGWWERTNALQLLYAEVIYCCAEGQCHLSDGNYCSHVPKAPVFAFVSLFFIRYILWWSFIPLY